MYFNCAEQKLNQKHEKEELTLKPEQLAVQKQEMESQHLLLTQQQEASNVIFEHFPQESALECSNMPFLCFAPWCGPSTISISPFGVTTVRNLIA